jgi:hypothetical protein
LAFPSATMPTTRVSTARSKNPETTNKFLTSELYVEKCNTMLWQHLPEAKFLTPDSVVKDELPRSHEGQRHFTEKTLSAQQTGHETFAEVVLTSLFAGVQTSSKQAAVIVNLTPFHGNIEAQSVHLQASKSWTGPRLATLSMTFDTTMLSMSKTCVKECLFKEWKSGTADELLGVDPNSETYKSEPPVFLGSAKRPALQIIQVSEDATDVKSLSIPQELVQQYGRDPLRKDEWLNIIKDLEHTFNTSLTSLKSAAAPSPGPSTSSLFPGDDVKRIDEVQAGTILCKFPGKDTSYSWVILRGPNRTDDDEYATVKGYIVSETDGPCRAEGQALAYGKGQWMKGKAAQDGTDLDAPGNRSVLCKFESLSNDLVVLEMAKGDGPPQNWVDVVLAIVKDQQASEGQVADMTLSIHRVLDVETSEETKLSNALVNPDSFKLDAKEMLVFKAEVLKDVQHARHTNAGILPPLKLLMDSPVLRLCWRVKFFDTCQEISPRKPLWFFRSPVILPKRGDMQRVF